MNINTEDDAIGFVEQHPFSKQFTIIQYRLGGHSSIPHNFFRNWLDEEAGEGQFYIGRCSGFGVGSLVKYDSGYQSLKVGRFVSGGLRLRFLLNGQHETRSISTYMFSVLGEGFQNCPPPQYPDTIIKNDVWIGDEAMVLGGAVIENGCIVGARTLVPPNFKSEAFGIYAGSPARLIRFRFPDKVREALLDLSWWDQPLSWILENNQAFLEDMTADEGKALDVISRLKSSI